MLILGGRYGSIDPETGKSYTHWEYDYAGEMGKRRFAIVINDNKLHEKAKENPDFLERVNYFKYQEFKKEVLSNISKFYEGIKDIKLVVMESLKEYESDTTLSGWIKADSVSNIEKILLENTKLLKNIDSLKDEITKLKKKIEGNDLIGNHSYEELISVLSAMPIKAPEKFPNFSDYDTMLSFFLGIRNALATGFTTRAEKGTEGAFVIRNVIPHLMAFGLVEKVKITGATVERLQTSKEGHRFLARHEVEQLKRVKEIS